MGDLRRGPGRASRGAAALVVLTSIGVGACVTQREVSDFSDSIETALGPRCLPTDHPLSRFVDSIGKRVNAADERPGDEMRFRILLAADANAIALANGAIYISLPLLLFLNSDEELAMILGHEIGHVRERHAVRTSNLRQWLKAITFIPLLPLNILSGNVYGEAALDAAFLSYSRSEERQADDVAAEVVQLAGFDLTCGAEAYLALERLERLARLENPDVEILTGIWSTHPDPGDRFDRITGRTGAAAPETGATRACGTGLLDRIDGFALGGELPPVVESDDGSIYFLHYGVQVGLDEHLLEYANGWLYVAGQRSRLERVDPEETIDWAQHWAREFTAGREMLLLDTTPNAGHPSVRAAWVTGEGTSPLVEFRHWIEIAGRVYRISSSMAPPRWRTADGVLKDLAEHLQPLDMDELPATMVPLEYGIHEVVEGETLESIAERNALWDAANLALRNGLEPGQSLARGMRLKVLRRTPLSFE